MRSSCIGVIPLALALGTGAMAQDAARGTVLYQTHCAVCHGETAQGDGPMAEVLTLPVPDLTALSGPDGFPLLRVIGRIDGRDPILAHGGPMPVFGEWFQGDGADVAMAGPGGQPVLMSRPIADLVAFLIEVQR